MAVCFKCPQADVPEASGGTDAASPHAPFPSFPLHLSLLSSLAGSSIFLGWTASTFNRRPQKTARD